MFETIKRRSSEIPNNSIAIRCADFIKPFERFVNHIYLCPAGIPTFGYGSLVKDFPDEPMLITEKRASELLINEISHKYLPAVMRLCKVNADNQIIALTSFVYNLGGGALQASTLRKKINRGDFEGASREFLKWDKARVNGVLKPLRGLTRRRQAESELFFSEI